MNTNSNVFNNKSHRQAQNIKIAIVVIKNTTKSKLKKKLNINEPEVGRMNSRIFGARVKIVG